jgi:hypothetical protein
MGAKKNFAPCMPAMIHVAHVFADEVANYGGLNLPHQVCRENKAAIQRHYYVQATAPVLP